MKNKLFFWFAGIVLFVSSLVSSAQILSDSFDSGLGAWTVSGGWAIDAGAVTDSPSSNYTNNTDVALTLASPLDFSSVINPALLLTHRYAIEPDYDAAILEVSRNSASTWEELARFSGNQLAWLSEQIDLSSVAGEASVLLRFRLQTDDSVVYDGWTIDEVWVDEVPGRAVITNVTAQGFSSVFVEWTAPVGSTIESYRVYRSRVSGSSVDGSVLVGETDGNTLSFTDFSIAPKNTFYYRVVSVDASGLFSVGEESSVTLAAGMDFPFLDNGEAGATHWVASGDWALAAEPGNAANMCWSDSPEGPYTNSINVSLTLVAPLNLSSGINPVLAFRHKLDLLVGDILSVEVSITDGADWISLQSFSAVTSTNQWTQENLSLAAYAGADSVLIRFLLTTTPADTADGCWLDEIAVAESPSPVTSLMIDQVQSHSLRLSWTQNLDTLFSHYAVYRKLGTANVDYHDELVAEISDQSQTQFVDTGLLLNSDYVYRVYGVSSYGTLSVFTAERTVLTENNPVPFVDDFEGGTNGWVLLGNWNLESDEMNSWLSDSPSDFYGNNQRDTDNYALTAVDLSDATWPVLSFRDKFSLTGNDRAWLHISKNGTTWIPRYICTGERTDWADQQIDLSEWAGEPNVRIRFYLYTDSATTADGWQIDDISVAEHIPAAAQGLPLYERFEDGATNWLNGGWVVNTNEAYEGGASVESLPIGFTPASGDIYACYGRTLNLAGSIAPQLTLWAKGYDDGRCYLYAQLSGNGGITWVDISGDMVAKPAYWTRFQFAVPEALRADGVRLRLRAYTYYDDKPTQFFVDKLTVEETPTWVTLGTPVPDLKSIDLAWSEYADDGTFQKYEVYRRESANVTVADTRVAVITNRTETAFKDTGLSIGKTYYYKVYVYNLNDTATPSNEGQSTTVPVILPINDPLDDLALWDTLGGWGIETNAAGSWLSDSLNSPYGNNQRDTDNYALTAVDLSDATWPVLSFRDKFSLTGNDRAWLHISKNGTTWSPRYICTGERTDWADQQIDLSEWAGEPNVRIRFYLYTDSATTADGWQIDDISVAEREVVAQGLPLYERFEDGATNWLNGGWVVNTNQAYEGTASVESLPIDFTPASGDIYASYGRALNLAGTIAPQLTLWAKGINDTYSRLYAQLSNNGGVSWTDISGDMDARPDAWARFQFAVPEAFKVDGVRLRIRAYTVSSDRATQFFVDKLTMEETPTWVTLGTPVPDLKSIDLAWSEFEDAGTFQKYEVYRRESANVTVADTRVAVITNRNETSYTDTGLSIGKTYYYKVYVYNLNDTATPSNEGQSTTVPVILPINDPLDDLALWDTLGGWGIETNAAGSWLSDSPDSPYSNSLNSPNNYALTAVDLSDATWPVLSFRDKFNLAGSISTDRGYLQISINGSTWFNRYAVTGSRAEWADQQIDLSEWAGESNVRIRFYLYTDSATTADGWQIDDISVAEHIPAAAQGLPLYERFEDGATNWIAGGWVVSTNEAYEGGASAESLPVDWVPAGVDIHASYGQELNLAGSIAPQLTLWAKGYDDSRCYLYAQLSNNGGLNWTDITGDMIAKPDQWTRFQFAIPEAFKVDGVRLRLWSRTYYNDKPTQFFVDKLTVEETPTWVTLGTPVPDLKSIDLAWSEYADDGTFQKYEVYRRESANVTVADTLVATITNRIETAFTDIGLSIGKTYYYRVYIVNLNDTATPSNEGQATTVPVTLPINDTLDDLALWDILGNWGIETNAAESWLSDSPDSPYSNSLNSPNNYALTAVDLSDATWPVLSFRDKFNLAGSISTDRGYLQISINGSTWFNRYAVTGSRAEWADQQIDLSEWAGESNVRIRFYLYTDSATTADGWQLDDIALEEHVPAAAQSLPLYERFEDGATNWIGGGWVVSTNEAYEGGASAESLPVGWVPAGVDIHASYGQELNLAGSIAPQLTLWAKGYDDSRCYLYAQLSNNGGLNWTDITGDMIAKPDQWTRFQFAIPEAFKVDGVRLRLWSRTYYNDKPTQFFVDRLTIGEVNPSAPVPLSPADGSVVGVLYPTLTVENAVDIVDDNSSYEFEVYTNAALDAEALVTRLPVQAAGDETTRWQIDAAMVDGTQYWWRSRATSSSGYLSEWSTTNTFHVVIVNHAPSTPKIMSPYGGSSLPDENGYFIWVGSTDSDVGDSVAYYQVEIASNDTFTPILLSKVDFRNESIGAIVLHEISGYESLALDAAYFWRIRAVDSYGLASAWATDSFVYGELGEDPVVIVPVTITDLSIDGSGVWLEWTPSESVAGVEFSPTLTPADWQPVESAQNIQTNHVLLASPPNSPQGFFRVVVGE